VYTIQFELVCVLFNLNHHRKLVNTEIRCLRRATVSTSIFNRQATQHKHQEETRNLIGPAIIQETRNKIGKSSSKNGH
jgi:hypothetical protein